MSSSAYRLRVVARIARIARSALAAHTTPAPGSGSRRRLVRAFAATLLGAALGRSALPLAHAAGMGEAGTDTAGTSESGRARRDYRIDIRQFAFAPPTLSVPAGARIVWTNDDEDPHVIVSSTGAFKASPALDTNDSYAVILDTPGTYRYFCSIHPMMVGTLVVR
ncbi:cupredoxin family copper-binding protein [Trinickia caryophylli]|uniref:Plastocyanin n=1 Tax=Trinickia caryophylli TaxID=28094 RepID=A0A1X7CGS4_TRICW|nr:cupredoxin family copper-binding protein [Trinickia caryophylli]WQE12801.1 cupredoxin family copper-binding protein [Trinickia caryophylli]GLU30518.1 hypothetical protein Busp01_03600 [Trinickia caryophylli]SME96275.1 Plastocyanin [Trinickia caryophylli]